MERREEEDCGRKPEGEVAGLMLSSGSSWRGLGRRCVDSAIDDGYRRALSGSNDYPKTRIFLFGINYSTPTPMCLILIERLIDFRI